MTTETNKKKRKKSEWLIMIYLAGDNNLSASSIALLQDLEAARRNRHVRVLAAFDSATPIPTGARYVEIKRERDEPGPFSRRIKWPIHNDLLTPGHIVVTPDFCAPLGSAHFPTQETVATALGRFLEFARAHYKAKKYILILFGHGTLVAGNTFLADTKPPSYLKLDEFSDILRDHFRKKIDILGFDNCVMNGIEAAVQLQGQVDYTIGSQDLMLTFGWPFRRIIETIGENHNRDSKYVSEAILRVCARNLLDFTFMERSSEQAICDVSKFEQNGPIVSAVKELSQALQCGLRLNHCGHVHFPFVRDVVRVARLEAQAYFGELFVDLYDFCELLIKRSNDILHSLNRIAASLLVQNAANANDSYRQSFKPILLPLEEVQELYKITTAAKQVLDIFRSDTVVPRAYYVCPQLQYSHGLSIFFPWTLPEGPITFEAVEGSGPDPSEYDFSTPFEVYRRYLFAQEDYGDWARFLHAFFKATLRDVRRVEFEHVEDNDDFYRLKPLKGENLVPAVDLQKTDSNTAQDEFHPPIKNYPRRFYISPADCNRQLPVFGLPGHPEPNDSNVVSKPGKVSYLGWNVRGLVAEVIGLPPDEDEEPPTSPPLSPPCY